jgi:hypothetical protein
MNNAYEVLGTVHSHPSLSQVSRPRQHSLHGETMVGGSVSLVVAAAVPDLAPPHARFPKDMP